jgi:hypothetical protein
MTLVLVLFNLFTVVERVRDDMYFLGSQRVVFRRSEVEGHTLVVLAMVETLPWDHPPLRFTECIRAQTMHLSLSTTKGFIEVPIPGWMFYTLRPLVALPMVPTHHSTPTLSPTPSNNSYCTSCVKTK